MSAPRQMTAHTLEAPKGWPSPHAVDFAAKLSANVTIDPLFAGRVVHLNAAGEYETGLPATIGKGHMPIFLFNNSDDPDVSNDGGDAATEAGVWVPLAPTGKMMGLVAVGAYELESTEFQSEASLGATYAPGDCLTATNANTTAATGGRITRTTNGLAYSAPVCGVVSRGVFTNSHGRSALAFWPVWLPQQA
ncbi:MAG TPA: hypothetical protein VM487_24215 [Phycisphaerae bacterium]|nr:hypothetical protein [Phycisphaerae bacterium]